MDGRSLVGDHPTLSWQRRARDQRGSVSQSHIGTYWWMLCLKLPKFHWVWVEGSRKESGANILSKHFFIYFRTLLNTRHYSPSSLYMLFLCHCRLLYSIQFSFSSPCYLLPGKVYFAIPANEILINRVKQKYERACRKTSGLKKTVRMKFKVKLHYEMHLLRSKFSWT